MGLQVRAVRYFGDTLLLKVFCFSCLTAPRFVLHDTATNRETDMTAEEMKNLHAAENAARRAGERLNVRFGDVWGHADLLELIEDLKRRVDELEKAR